MKRKITFLTIFMAILLGACGSDEKKEEVTKGISMLSSVNKVFVYGSLREGFHNYQKYLVDRVEKSELGIVQGKLFALEGLGLSCVTSWI